MGGTRSSGSSGSGVGTEQSTPPSDLTSRRNALLAKHPGLRIPDELGERGVREIVESLESLEAAGIPLHLLPDLLVWPLSGDEGGTLGRYRPSNHSIQLNEDLLPTMGRQGDLDYALGWVTSPGVQGVVLHEMAHGVHRLLLNSDQRIEYRGRTEYVSNVVQNFLRDLEAPSGYSRFVKNNDSNPNRGYGEVFAEAFAGAFSRTNNGHPSIGAMKSFLDDLLPRVDLSRGYWGI